MVSQMRRLSKLLPVDPKLQRNICKKQEVGVCKSCPLVPVTRLPVHICSPDADMEQEQDEIRSH